jgi:DNA-directed RNA polymerase specialized sigma24 family protein
VSPEQAWDEVVEHLDVAWIECNRLTGQQRRRGGRAGLISSTRASSEDLWPWAVEGMWRALRSTSTVNEGLLHIAAKGGAIDGLRRLSRADGYRRTRPNAPSGWGFSVRYYAMHCDVFSSDEEAPYVAPYFDPDFEHIENLDLLERSWFPFRALYIDETVADLGRLFGIPSETMHRYRREAAEQLAEQLAETT